jgi:molybdate transport system ATP-binding protein
VKLTVEVRARAGTFRLDAAFEAPGGITALFGPSGAGKSLTLRCVAGLVRPDAGRVAVGDRVLFDSAGGTDLPARERRTGYVFQQYALFPHLDVAGNVGFGMRGGREERAERTEALLELVGLAGYARRRPGELSGGEQQRVALARALAPRPALMLLDEPFSAVDAGVRRRLRAELRRIHEATGVPMVLVTHSHAEMRGLSDWLVLCDAGRVLRAGATAEVLAEPGSARAAELLEDVYA